MRNMPDSHMCIAHDAQYAGFSHVLLSLGVVGLPSPSPSDEQYAGFSHVYCTRCAICRILTCVLHMMRNMPDSHIFPLPRGGK